MLLRKGLGIWVLVMDNMMENDPMPRRHMRVFQEGISLHVHYLKLVKFVFMRNAKVLYPLCKKLLICMNMRYENQVYLQFPLKMNVLLLLKGIPKE